MPEGFSALKHDIIYFLFKSEFKLFLIFTLCKPASTKTRIPIAKKPAIFSKATLSANGKSEANVERLLAKIYSKSENIVRFNKPERAFSKLLYF